VQANGVAQPPDHLALNIAGHLVHRVIPGDRDGEIHDRSLPQYAYRGMRMTVRGRGPLGPGGQRAVGGAAKRDPDAVVRDDKDRPRIIKKPTQVPGLSKVVSIAVGIDTNTVIDASGAAYSWGFSSNNQTGLGTEDDVDKPTKLEAKSVIEEKLVWAGAGGQYGMVASEA